MTFGGLHSPAQLTKSVESFLSYRNGNAAGPVEATPIVWNGKLAVITADSMNGAYQGTFRIDTGIYDERPLARITAPDMRYLCAIVDGTRAYVFGTDSTHKNIRMMYSDDLLNWSAPVVVFTDTIGRSFFNTSVCKKPDGSFVMAVETIDPAFPSIPFVIRFLSSQDLLTWTQLAGLYNNNVFTNCPTIRYVDGMFYMLYMSSAFGAHCTFITRSSDLIGWQNSSGTPDGLTVPFCPSANEGNNNSDVDLVGHNGSTYFTYARGDQNAWLELSAAKYPATPDVFLKSFF